MKKIASILMLLLLAGCAASAQSSFSGNHVEVGVFADYTRLQFAPRDMIGVGGRVAVNVHPNVQLEAEMSYDFARAVGEPFTEGPTTNVYRTQIRKLDGLFGPKIQFGKLNGMGSLRAFATVKGGFVNFGFTNQTAPSGFVSQFNSIRNNNNLNAAFYPGGGVEGFLGPIGLRLDIGDEIYFLNGAHNNLKVSFGPQIRF